MTVQPQVVPGFLSSSAQAQQSLARPKASDHHQQGMGFAGLAEHDGVLVLDVRLRVNYLGASRTPGENRLFCTRLTSGAAVMGAPHGQEKPRVGVGGEAGNLSGALRGPRPGALLPASQCRNC